MGERCGFRSEPLTLDAAARAAAPGRFLELPDGMVHYEVVGPPEAQVVVLVPGFSIPYFVWDPTFEGLVKAGFRVLRYDLYGRGYSDRPDTLYGRDLYERQLSGLLDALGIEQPVNVVGLSMGGAIAMLFADRHPERVRRLCLMDAAGLPQEKPWKARLVLLPVVGEWLMDVFGGRLLMAELRDDFLRLERVGERMREYEERYRLQMQYAGFRRALLSTLRSGILTGVQDVYERVGRMDFPVLVVWGREDTIVPFEVCTEIQRLIPRAQVYVVEGVGHGPHFERPDEVNSVLTEFFG